MIIRMRAVVQARVGDEFAVINVEHATCTVCGATTDRKRLATKLSPAPLDRVFDDWMFSTRWASIVAYATAAELPARYRPATQ